MFRASLKSTGYLFVADNIDLSSLSFYDSALQKATYSKVVHNGRSRSSKLVPISPVRFHIIIIIIIIINS